MEGLYTRMIDMVERARAWLDTHRDLGGRYLAPMCMVLFFMVGFWFLLRSLGLI